MVTDDEMQSAAQLLENTRAVVDGLLQRAWPLVDRAHKKRPAADELWRAAELMRETMRAVSVRVCALDTAAHLLQRGEKLDDHADVILRLATSLPGWPPTTPQHIARAREMLDAARENSGGTEK
mgnify:CR=1 FL=1